MPSIAKQFAELYDKALIRFQNSSLRSTDFPDLSANEEHYIDLLYDLGKTTLTAFSRKAKISKPAATRIIHSFLDKGYLSKTPSQTDKRVSYLELNAELQEHCRKNLELADTIFLDMLSVLDEKERKQLAYLINKVNKEFR
ncbi:MarR family transcriptional regulator [Streptococcus chenjunshii]|uniref:MarR family transcriptional regulator n=1 Tax=Streptococcus chenjunshii TaxID=2173853 RepID=A0A372KK30_9STRE|nr:MarR family transcriptional regulator [Streptococcus chenjunshii]AXQ78919.1 MarR family transcriptional regulator [Streptococcus chenjunshii]RFU50411.1 MarR family transcriptional regulator [Streptococcus chenjunshii]RFU52639.1 MarR family transcriptional regulator [Streptococcus chenjunshii]